MKRLTNQNFNPCHICMGEGYCTQSVCLCVCACVCVCAFVCLSVVRCPPFIPKTAAALNFKYGYVMIMS